MKKSFALLILAAAAPLLAGNNGKLNDTERAFLIDQLEQSRQGMLASIQGLTDAQWRFKPAPAVWSVQECAEHIILSEDYIFGLSQQMLKSPAVERPANSNPEFDKVLVGKVEDRSQKGHAPEPLVPAQRFATPADAAKEFTLRRAKTLAYVKTTSDDLRVHVGPSPAGSIDAYQFLLLLSAHSARHTAQIREVEANAAYPKTTAALAKFLVVYTLAHGTPADLTPPQMAKLQEHVAYLTTQVKNGVLLWGGRTADAEHPRGYAEIQVASEADAKTYVANDPAVQAGIFEYTLQPFVEITHSM